MVTPASAAGNHENRRTEDGAMLWMLSGCLMSAHTEVVTSTRPTIATAPGTPVSADACTAFLLGFLPIPGRDDATVDRLLEQVTQQGTYAVVDLAVDQRTFWALVATARCVRVSGRRVDVEAPAIEAPAPTLAAAAPAPAPVVRLPTITCMDGTPSDTCLRCAPGCCEGHGGCE